VTMRDYVDERFAAMEKSTALMREVMEHRLLGMNEFREQLQMQAQSFITRIEYEQIREQIRSLEMSRAEITGKADQRSVQITLLISVMALVIGIIGIILRITA